MTFDTFVKDAFPSSQRHDTPKSTWFIRPNTLRSTRKKLSYTKQGQSLANLCEGLITRSQIKSARSSALSLKSKQDFKRRWLLMSLQKGNHSLSSLNQKLHFLKRELRPRRMFTSPAMPSRMKALLKKRHSFKSYIGLDFEVQCRRMPFLETPLNLSTS